MRACGDNASTKLKLYSGFTYWIRVVLFLVIIWSPSLHQVRGTTAECCEDPIREIQATCMHEDDSLSEAEYRKNSSSICRSFHDFLQCVGKNVPGCMERVADIYHNFTLPPWSCSRTREQIIQYQEFVQKGCGQLVRQGTESTADIIFPSESINKTGHESHQGPDTKENTSDTSAYSPSPVGLIWIPWLVCLWTIRLLPT